MLGLLILIILGILAITYTPKDKSKKDTVSERLANKLDQLWVIAQDASQNNKYLRAEKALLTILRIDERNTSAYNRLGILYAKQKSLDDAIECFEIAQSLEPNASSLHNVGLIYYETGQYDKASLAFQQALAIDDQLPARYIAYAKVQEKLGDYKKMIEALEQAIKLEPNLQTFNILADAYERIGETEKSQRLKNKIQRLIKKQTTVKKIRQPRRVVM